MILLLVTVFIPPLNRIINSYISFWGINLELCFFWLFFLSLVLDFRKCAFAAILLSLIQSLICFEEIKVSLVGYFIEIVLVYILKRYFFLGVYHNQVIFSFIILLLMNTIKGFLTHSGNLLFALDEFAKINLYISIYNALLGSILLHSVVFIRKLFFKKHIV